MSKKVTDITTDIHAILMGFCASKQFPFLGARASPSARFLNSRSMHGTRRDYTKHTLALDHTQLNPVNSGWQARLAAPPDVRWSSHAAERGEFFEDAITLPRTLESMPVCMQHLHSMCFVMHHRV